MRTVTLWTLSRSSVLLPGHSRRSLTFRRLSGSWRLRETRDISLSMLVLYAAGVFLWLVYGVWANALPIIGANGISLVLILVLLGIKLRYR